jgi:hypothetical protein
MAEVFHLSKVSKKPFILSVLFKNVRSLTIRRVLPNCPVVTDQSHVTPLPLACIEELSVLGPFIGIFMLLSGITGD